MLKHHWAILFLTLTIISIITSRSAHPAPPPCPPTPCLPNKWMLSWHGWQQLCGTVCGCKTEASSEDVNYESTVLIKYFVIVLSSPGPNQWNEKIYNLGVLLTPVITLSTCQWIPQPACFDTVLQWRIKHFLF